jgi:ketosteroid isomerase-like protein
MLFSSINISIVQADDLEQFKEAVERYNNSVAKWDLDNRGDLEAEAVGLESMHRNLTNNKIRNKELWKKAIQGWLSQYEYYDIDMVTLHTDVIGNIGIASGKLNIKRKHKENPEISFNKRWSSTWLKTNGQWKLIFYHREFIDEKY